MNAVAQQNTLFPKPDSMTILFVLGTRPEAVKLAPVIAAFRTATWCSVRVVLTDQHPEMVGPILQLFGIAPDTRLQVMRRGQSPLRLAARVMEKLEPVLTASQPNLVIVQGDTTSAMAAAMAAFHHKIPVAHVEAGLRTNNRYSPFPEEMNRRVITQLATLHCAATNANRHRLLAEGVPPEAIAVTGNPVIDTLQQITASQLVAMPTIPGLDPQNRLVVVTTHRRENFGEPQAQILQSVGLLVERFPDVAVVLPVHPNPHVRRAVDAHLPSHPRIHPIAPLGYPEFISLVARSFFVMSDSGGLQEESPALGKPLLVLRTETEREEVVESGSGMIVPLRSGAIAEAAGALLTNASLYRTMSRKRFPFGRGNAATKILKQVERWSKQRM
jgi:UDP-N-acetylglucosamine 2-epimerase (non-hydrolysing)